jgi:hypothetical protein
LCLSERVKPASRDDDVEEVVHLVLEREEVGGEGVAPKLDDAQHSHACGKHVVGMQARIVSEGGRRVHDGNMASLLSFQWVREFGLEK